MTDLVCKYLQTLTYVLLYEYDYVIPLHEANVCVLLYNTCTRARTLVCVPGTVAAACCMLQTAGAVCGIVFVADGRELTQQQ